jgi:biopolymer transport protein ExbD
MRIQDNAGEEEALNLTPLIDMVFLLLIFFLVATTIAQDERPQSINLPVTGATSPLSAPPEEIINIEKDGVMKVNGQVNDRDQLRATLEQAKLAQPPRNVLIRADQESMHKYFATVASLCHEVGVNQINIGYVYDKVKE